MWRFATGSMGDAEADPVRAPAALKSARGHTDPCREGGWLMKYFLILAVMFGMYIGINVVSAESASRDFAEAVQVAVNRKAASQHAEADIADAIRIAAEKRGIELDANAIRVKQSRAAVGGGYDYVIATASVSYDREIVPFYSKRLTITRTNR
jgi:nitrogen fixation protein FixH